MRHNIRASVRIKQPPLLCSVLLMSDMLPILSLTHLQVSSLCELRAPPWSTGSMFDHRSLPPRSNLGVGISEGCFIFDFASSPLEVARGGEFRVDLPDWCMHSSR